MGSPDPIDLSDIDPRIWRVKAGEAVYGPYTLGQLRHYVIEGRIAAHTLIAEGVGDYVPAPEHPPIKAALDAMAEKTAERPTGQATNFFIMVQSEGSTGAIVQAISEMGSFVEAFPGALLLRTDLRLSKVRSRLKQVSKTGDKIVIVDAKSNRLAWSGLQPDQDVAVREHWNAEQDGAA